MTEKGKPQFNAWEEAVLERLDVIIKLLRNDREHTAAVAAPDTKVVDISSRLPARKRSGKHRIGEATYRSKSIQLVQILLAAGDIGKLTTSLQEEMVMGHSTFSLVLRRLASDRAWLHVQNAAPGQARYIRITDKVTAQEWLEDRLTEPETQNG